MEKNYPKYYSYKYAFEQINAAIQAGFFLEAITIEESILTDRLYRFCKDHGFKKKADRATLGDGVNFIKDLHANLLLSEEIDFIPDLARFWANRNQCLHQIVKSEPGEAPILFEEFIQLAKETAIEGKALEKRISKWAKKRKRRNQKLELNAEPEGGSAG